MWEGVEGERSEEAQGVDRYVIVNHPTRQRLNVTLSQVRTAGYLMLPNHTSIVQ